MIKITRTSPVTGAVNSMEIEVTLAQMDEFLHSPNRRMIQDIFPNLSPDEREFIKTGITPVEWKKLFGDEHA